MRTALFSYLSAAVAAGLFLFFHYGLVFPAGSGAADFLLALVLAVMAYIGLILVMPREKTLAEEFAGMAASYGFNAEEAAVLIGSAAEKIATIRAASRDPQIKPAVSEKITAIAHTAETIINELKADPSDIGRSKHFLYHYLDAAIDIIEKYRVLLSKKGDTDHLKSVLEKSEQALDEIQKVFEKQYQRNLENEAMELDVQLDVLKNMIKSEGL